MFLLQSIFKEMMLFQFLNVLFQVLIHKSHDLLQEDIAVTIYNMAAVDFDAFYSTFLPQFLQSCQGVDDTQKALLSHNFKLELVGNDLFEKVKAAAFFLT